MTTRVGPWLGTLTLALLACFALVACTGTGEVEEPVTDAQILELEAKVRSLEELLQTVEDQNAELRGEITSLRQEQDELIKDFEMAESAFEAELDLLTKEGWSKEDKEDFSDGDVLETTARLAEEANGEVHYLHHPGRPDPSVLVTPLEFVDGRTPLIVSLHGYGGTSADHSYYFPLHERVNAEGFALLLPNGGMDAEGYQFWNPTDRCCDNGKTGGDDVSFLTELVAEAERIMDFGPVYFFGYSNGGFMAYHMACKGLPGLRAVASLAGTSYVESASCDGATPVSVLHIHGTADDVILYEGDRSEPDPEDGGEPAFYTGALDMVMRWSRQAGCTWDEDIQPYTTLDLDNNVPGAETQAFRQESGCAEGIVIELWKGLDSGHSPDYGDAFIDGLLAWLLSKK